jgi:peptidyl-prolyl cis-trans isomerase SurA
MFNNRVKAFTRSLLFSFVLLTAANIAEAQQVADKILAVVGKNRIILNSELEKQVEQLRLQNPEFHDTMRCQILEQMMISKLMIEQADRDSIFVSEEDVEGQLDNNIRYYIRAYGSQEKMEKELGKTVYQIKEEFREIYREQLLAQKVQGQLIQNVKITPAEVKEFFDEISRDTLPFIPATIELGQIVIDPPANEELDREAKKSAEELHQRITEKGESFEMLAGIYSQDPGSRDNGGDLGVVSRTDLVPAFSSAAFKLKDGEISNVVKTQYGYHIIQMMKRMGDQAQIRHILIHPAITSIDIKKAMDKLDSVRAELVSGKITFATAVGKYSTDDGSKRTGGMIADPQTGNTQIELDKLDPAMILMLDSLKAGSFSQPQIFTNDRGEKSCRIVYVKSRVAPHTVNMQDDYARIQELALNRKKVQKMEEWIAQKLPSYYIKLDPEYRSCGMLDKWYKASASSNGSNY